MSSADTTAAVAASTGSGSRGGGAGRASGQGGRDGAATPSAAASPRAAGAKDTGGSRKSKGSARGSHAPATNPNKMIRKLHAAADRDMKRAKRAVTDRSGGDAAPRVVAVVGARGVGKSSIVRALVKHYTRRKLGDILGPATVVAGKQRRLTFVEVEPNLAAMTDAAKVCDLALLVIDAHFGLEMETFEFLNIAAAHGMPRVMGVLTHLDKIREGSRMNKTKKKLKARFWTEVHQGAKLFYLSGMRDNGEYLKREVLNLARFISVSKYQPLSWRNEHPYVLADRVEDVTPPEEGETSDRRVVAYGYVRGAPMRAQAVHIPGVGDLRVDRVEAVPDPCPAPGAMSASSGARRRTLNDKDRGVYAPMSDVDGVQYDRDAVYINLPDRYVRFTRQQTQDGAGEGESSGARRQAEKEEGGGSEEENDSDVDEAEEGIKMVRALQRAKVSIGDRVQQSSLQLVRGGRSLTGEELDPNDAAPDGHGRVDDDYGVDGGGNDNRVRRPATFGEDGEDGGFGSDEDERDDLPSSPVTARPYHVEGFMRRTSLQELVYGGDGDAGAPGGRSAGVNGVNSDSDADEAYALPRRRQRRLDGADMLREDCSVWPVDDAAEAGEEEDGGVEGARGDDIATDPLVLARFADQREREDGDDHGGSGGGGGGSSDEDDDDARTSFGDLEDLEADDAASAPAAERRERDDDSDSGRDDHDSGDSSSSSLSDAGAHSHRRRRRLKAEQKAAFDATYDEGGAGSVNARSKRDSGDAVAPGEPPMDYNQLQMKIAEERRQHNDAELHDVDPALRAQLEGVQPGAYVRVELSGVPVEFVRHFDPRRLVILGAMPHTMEHTHSLVRLRVKRHRWYRKVLKTRDPLVISAGWRRFESAPVFSIADASNVRNRMLKYTPEHMHCDAVLYGPVAPPGTGVVCFQALGGENRSGFRIAASGVVKELDADFRIVKKLKLVGEPQRVMKNTAYIKGMFNSELEVAKFVGSSLRTPSGIRGAVKKAVKDGPAGAFRATFEDKILMSDLVFLRAWVPVEPPRYCAVAANLLQASSTPGTWRGMKSVRELREERQLPIPLDQSSLYRDVERVERRFNPLMVPRALQAALPFASKPKLQPAVSAAQRERRRRALPGASERAVVLTPEEKREYSFMQMVNTVRKERERKRKDTAKRKRDEKAKEEQREEERRHAYVKERRKSYFARQSKQGRGRGGSGTL